MNSLSTTSSHSFVSLPSPPESPLSGPKGHDPPGRRPYLRQEVDRVVRPDPVRPGRFTCVALGLFQPSPRKLPVHRAGVPRHQGTLEARRRLHDVQLLPPGLGGRPPGGDGREGLRPEAAGDLAALPGEDRLLVTGR